MIKTVFMAMLTLFLMNSVSLAERSTPLPVDKAFAFSVYVDQNNQVVLEWNIAPGYYLYRNKLKFTPTSRNHMDIGSIQLPVGQPRHDMLHGDYQAYTGSLKIPLVSLQSKKGVLDLTIAWQGCSSAGFCYTPIKKSLKVDLSAIAMPQNLSQYVQTASDTLKPAESDDYLSEFFKGRHFPVIIFSFLGLGLLLAFTPCVLPMVPILSGIIVGQSRQKNKKKSFFLSLAYVAGMSITYAIAGVVIALIGSNIQAQLQQPWIIILFSGVFVLLALSLFGFYELQLPSRFRQKITALSNKQSGGTYVGVFLMGCLSTLIVSPCVSAPLVGVLAYIGQTGDVLLGALALWALGIGMGIPLLLIGISADRLLPKAGLWMTWVEKIFGFVMLGVAIWMLSRLVPDHAIFFKKIHSMNEFESQLRFARQHHQPVLLDFYADWCNSCVMMDRTVFSREDVQNALKKIKVLRADLTQNTAFDQAMLKRFHIVGPPGIVFFDHNGQELTSPRIIGEVNTEEFLAQLTKVS